MVPASFPESNDYLSKPQDMTDDQCDPLSIWRGNIKAGDNNDTMPCVISCWKLTVDEYLEFVKAGTIWLVVIGHTMPPVMMLGAKPTFPEDTDVKGQTG